MGGYQNIILPWPPKELNPNARVHFHTRASHARSYREAAYWLTRNSKVIAPDDGEVSLRIDFYPPDRRARDLDNMLSSCKSALDGLADALEVNDKRFALHLHRQESRKGGAVIVSII